MATMEVVKHGEGDFVEMPVELVEDLIAHDMAHRDESGDAVLADDIEPADAVMQLAFEKEGTPRVW